jgi:hypothetical protein
VKHYCPILLSVSLTLISCSPRNSETHELSSAKQKQRVCLLQKKLQIAERAEGKIKNQIEHLKTDLREAQLSLIRKKVEAYENGLKKRVEDATKTELFLEEREKLYQILQQDTSSFEAQVVLDRILGLITDLGNDSD